MTVLRRLAPLLASAAVIALPALPVPEATFIMEPEADGLTFEQPGDSRPSLDPPPEMPPDHNAAQHALPNAGGCQPMPLIDSEGLANGPMPVKP